MKYSIILSLSLWIFISDLSAQQTIRVPSDFNSIQLALDSVEEGATILVAPSTYFENLVWPENVDGIKLIGEMGAENTIIDGGGEDRVIYMTGSNSQGLFEETLISGFTIQNGYAEDDAGAGIYISGASPALRNLIVQNNRGVGFDENIRGGGMCIKDFVGTIDDCYFLNNTLETVRGSEGAGLYLEASGKVLVQNCTFDSNPNKAFGLCLGGGMYITSQPSSDPAADPPSVIIKNCIVSNNSTTAPDNSSGAGIYVTAFVSDTLEIVIDSCQISNNTTNISDDFLGGGGGLYLSNSALIMSNSVVSNNSSDSGAGIFFAREVLPSKISNTIISQNKLTTDDGFGGTAIFNLDPVELTMENCLITNNEFRSILMITLQAVGDEVAKLNLINCTVANNENAFGLFGVNLNIDNSIYGMKKQRYST